MSSTPTRHYHHIREDQRIHIIALREQGCTLKDISLKTKVKRRTVQSVLRKWKRHHTIQDLPKAGRPSKLDDRTRRRLTRMILRGDVGTATELAETAAAHDIAHITPQAARNVLHDEGLKAMHTIRKPLLTRLNMKTRLEFARVHHDWTVQQWKQVIFSDETVIPAR